jgi:SlyX protein
VADKVQEQMIALEIRLAHFERMVEDMSEVVARQDDAIGRLTLQLRRLNDRVKELGAGWQPSPQDEKPPPHY